MLLGEMIKHQRERAGLTQAEVAKKAGLKHVTHLAMIEAGKRRQLAPDVFLGLSRALKIDLKALVVAASKGPTQE